MLIASFALVSKYGMSPFDWQKVIARLFEIWIPLVACFKMMSSLRDSPLACFPLRQSCFQEQPRTISNRTKCPY